MAAPTASSAISAVPAGPLSTRGSCSSPPGPPSPEQPPRQPSGVCPCPALRATGAIGAGPARRLVAMSSALDAVADGRIPAEIVAVGADKDCAGLERARAAGVEG
jgi:hypothetical protein